MSESYSAASVVRCPLCHVGAVPAHIGHSVFVCEACGRTFRVVRATAGKTGARLGKFTESTVKWKRKRA